MNKIIIGQGNTSILFLHGTHTLYDSNWMTQICELIDQEKFKIICPEFPSIFKENSEKVDMTLKLTPYLKEFIKTEGHDEGLIIIGKSLGAKVAVELAKNIKIKQLILLGYPFTNKNSEIRKKRLEKINSLRVPTCIIQGSNDRFGKEAICSKLNLPNNILIRWIPNTNHSFFLGDEKKLSKETLAIIKNYLESALNI